jgi:RAS protein activator-like 2
VRNFLKINIASKSNELFCFKKIALHHKEGKRRRNTSRSTMEQCEKEIHRLQSSVDILRQKLEESELREANDSLDAISPAGDTKIRSIISR